MPLSDAIEQFIISLLQENDQIDLQRNELAQQFSCVPSQINYVLSTRFNTDRGYLIESRRGGGGYIRVVRVNTQTDANTYLMHLINQRIGETLSTPACQDILAMLAGNGLVTAREAALLLSALQDSAFPPNIPADTLRAGLLKAMLKQLLRLG